MWKMIIDCVIIYNMIVEYERDKSITKDWQFRGELVQPVGGVATFANFINFHKEMCGRDAHMQLQNDLVEHMWQPYGNQL